MLLKHNYHLASVQIHQLWSWIGKVKTQASFLIMPCELPPSVFTIKRPLLMEGSNFPPFFPPGLPGHCIDQCLKDILIQVAS